MTCECLTLINMKTKNKFEIGQTYKSTDGYAITIARIDGILVYYHSPYKENALIDATGMYFLENSVYAQNLKLIPTMEIKKSYIVVSDDNEWLATPLDITEEELTDELAIIRETHKTEWIYAYEITKEYKRFKP